MAFHYILTFVWSTERVFAFKQDEINAFRVSVRSNPSSSFSMISVIKLRKLSMMQFLCARGI